MSGARLKAATAAVDSERAYDLEEGLKLLLSLKSAKFNESVDLAVNLNLDARQSEQNVRGSCSIAAWPRKANFDCCFRIR